MVALKAYVGGCKKKFSKKVTSSEDWTGDRLRFSLMLSYLS